MTKTSYQILKVLSFRYFTSFINSLVHLSGEKKNNFPGWREYVEKKNKRKKRKSNLALVVVLLPETKGLYTLTNKLPFHNFPDKKVKGVTFDLPYEQRFLSCGAFSVYQVVRVA